MKRLGLRSVVVKKFRPTKNDAVYHGGENVLGRNFSAAKRNTKWVSDITYIHTVADGWCYLASIMDLATVKIVGWSFSKTMDTSLVLTALDHALTIQKSRKGLILHSDRGSQYTIPVTPTVLNLLQTAFSNRSLTKVVHIITLRLKAFMPF